MMANPIFLMVMLVSAASVSLATDPGPLQDFCVADYNSNTIVNGYPCKDPSKVQASDFFYRGLNIPGDTSSSPVGSNVNIINDAVIPGLNTQSLTIVRIDIAPLGVNAPHYHPRAAEVITVLEGSLFAGFVTTNPNNTFISKQLMPGDVFVFPQGLIHFQFNADNTNAVAIAAFNSQNPGVMTIGNAVFGSDPKIAENILARTFRVDPKIIRIIQSKF